MSVTRVFSSALSEIRRKRDSVRKPVILSKTMISANSMPITVSLTTAAGINTTSITSGRQMNVPGQSIEIMTVPI